MGDRVVSASAASEAGGWLEGYQPRGRPRLSQALLRVHWPRCAWRLVAAAIGASPWSKETFRFRGEVYHYFEHPYNATWLNERRVEIPLAARLLGVPSPAAVDTPAQVSALPIDALVRRRHFRRLETRSEPRDEDPGGSLQGDEHGDDDVLEIGCVLRHYGFDAHPVVDRYERGPRVTNVDICDFDPPRRYAAVLSISTLEHVGLDEPIRSAERCLAALEHIHRLVAPGGVALVTVPTGYNPSLDAALAAGRTFGLRWRGMVRLDRANHWVEASPAEALARGYGAPFLWANGLLVGVT